MSWGFEPSSNTGKTMFPPWTLFFPSTGIRRDVRLARARSRQTRGTKRLGGQWKSSSSSGGLLYEPLYPRDGDLNPLRAVVELVAELVDRLLELEHREQPLDRHLARREQRLVDRAEVAVEELPARLLFPAFRDVDAAKQRRRARDVRERAEHPGDVAQRRALAPPLGHRARGLALEVENHPVLVRPECLAQVVVAVRADDPPAGRRLREHAQELADLLPAAVERRE